MLDGGSFGVGVLSSRGLLCIVYGLWGVNSFCTGWIGARPARFSAADRTRGGSLIASIFARTSDRQTEEPDNEITLSPTAKSTQ